MSPVAPSACPLCRNPFKHFASVCVPLHSAIARLFPDAHRRRSREVRAQEESELFTSPELPEAVLGGDLAADLVADFACCACGALAVAPAVLNCGHIVCSCGPCKAPGVGVPCPSCDTPSPAAPRCCTLLQTLAQAAAPDAYAKRASAAAGRSATSGGSSAEAEVFRPGVHVRIFGLKAAPDLNDRQGILVGFDADSGRWRVRLRDEKVLGVKPDNLIVDGFVHFGRGCDSCGSYPVVGACWHCLDCPEQIGYDLCSACKESGRAPAAGRFNQRHLPSHRLEEVPQTRSWLHEIQDQRPDLSLQQILELVEHMNAEEGPEQEGHS